jgi:hypothetical protein
MPAIPRLPPLASRCTLRCYAPIYGLARLIPPLNRRGMTSDDDRFRIQPGRVSGAADADTLKLVLDVLLRS